MTLDTRLRNAARQVSGITIWRTLAGHWQAGMTIDGHGWVCETDPDLPTALMRLLARYRGPSNEAVRGRMTMLLNGDAT